MVRKGRNERERVAEDEWIEERGCKTRTTGNEYRTPTNDMRHVDNGSNQKCTTVHKTNDYVNGNDGKMMSTKMAEITRR